ncbi:AAA family ATPase [Paenibacillus selenitireducens]|uniref:AAA family ATPase n=1 Tax=Paenibacillus selenitireducens TaxID=1324314 RepID=A0A1T2X1N8_9BACL|nr:DNA topology modulation protein [Paenibacillus selenitireducens]OPA73801.1 AAA family ATPase [Paenibacillus selenitireducens]
MKIMIIGSSGSGKSTFSRQLGDLLDLPVYHLDVYFWKPGWVQTPDVEWVEFNKNLVAKDEWIIDGYYGRTMDIRVQAADVIFFLDLPPWITIYRVIKRRIQYHGKTRPDLNEGCPESLDWQFIKYAWRFRQDKKPAIIEKLEKHAEKTKIIMMKSPKEVKRLLNTLQSNGIGYFEHIEKHHEC